MYKHFLVPTDGSALSNQTISGALTFAKDAGACVTFFYAAPDYLATDSGSLMRSLLPAVAAEHIAGDAHAVLMKAAAAARAIDVSHRLVYCISAHPHQAIVKAAEEHGCDLIYMASRGPKSIGGLLLGSETLKVLMNATVPVLVSSVMRNSTTPDMSMAIGIIQDEHRSLAAFLHSLRQMTDAAHTTGNAPDFELIDQIFHYIRDFPDTLHHPKESSYLFARLRQRTGQLNGVLDQLDGDHGDKHLRDALDKALQNYRRLGPAGLEAFSQALEQYTTNEWRHMSLEEHTVLPAAREHLLPTDWKEIAEAFGANGDPRFSAERSESFRTMFSKLARLAAHTMHAEGEAASSTADTR